MTPPSDSLRLDILRKSINVTHGLMELNGQYVRVSDMDAYGRACAEEMRERAATRAGAFDGGQSNCNDCTNSEPCEYHEGFSDAVAKIAAAIRSLSVEGE